MTMNEIAKKALGESKDKHYIRIKDGEVLLTIRNLLRSAAYVAVVASSTAFLGGNLHYAPIGAAVGFGTSVLHAELKAVFRL